MTWTGYVYFMAQLETHPLGFLPILSQLGSDYQFTHVFYANTEKTIPLMEGHANIFRVRFNETSWETRPNFLTLLTPIFKFNPIGLELFYQNDADFDNSTQLKLVYAGRKDYFVDLLVNMKDFVRLPKREQALELLNHKLPFVFQSSHWGAVELRNIGIFAMAEPLFKDFDYSIPPAVDLKSTLSHFMSMVF